MTHHLVPAPPTLVLRCPRKGCKTRKGPYYSPAIANSAMIEHFLAQHADEYTEVQTDTASAWENYQPRRVKP